MNGGRPCPRCDGGLTLVLAGGIQVDGCPRCGGLWFDARELGQLAQVSAEEMGALERRFEPAAAAAGRAPGTPRLCPGCRVSLRQFEYPWARGVLLDHCLECHGIWVDDGELGEIEQIVNRQRSTAAGPEAPTDGTPAATCEQRARMAASLMLSRACEKCGERNGARDLVCWACGTMLQERTGGLLCPHCSSPMARCQARGMSLDRCNACGGLWLDGGELGSLLQLDREALLDIRDRFGGGRAGLNIPGERTRALCCPNCHRALREHPYGLQSGVLIDSCPYCRGLWLETGELAVVHEFVRRQEGTTEV